MPHSPKVAAGRGYLAIPGPSVVPEAVLNAMHRPAPNIYAGELPDLMPKLVEDLKRVARTSGHVAIYIANGHGVWEAGLSNVIAPGEKVLVLATGFFGHGWAGMASGIGAEVDILDFGKAATIDLERLAEALKADADQQIKAVLAVHVDTSSSIRNDIAAVRAVLDEVDHPALLMVDCIASLACEVFEMDAWGVDVMVAGCQKGLMVPPGMGFVFFNEKAANARASMTRVSRYWDWTPRAHAKAFYEFWNGTAPTHHVYGLRMALDMIHAEGIEAVWSRHETLARAIWAACDAWAEGGMLKMNVQNYTLRSHAVTALHLEAPLATDLREWTSQKLGLTLGIGLGMVEPDDPNWHGFFRLGHMGHINGHMIMGLLGGIEAGMKALDIPHGPDGLSAAAEAIGGG